MKNILENKSKFFARYWGQRVLYYTGCTGLMQVSAVGLKKSVAKFSYLVLNDLSLITDEDAVHVAEIENDRYTDDKLIRGQVIVRNFVQYSDCTHSLKNNDQLFEMIDYLLSKGYALPWMGLSVKQLEEYGWIKIKTLNP